MSILTELKYIGYEVVLHGDNIRLSYKGKARPDEGKVIPLINELKALKEEAIKELKNEGIENKPFIDKSEILIIPFNCDPKYHWWSGGQSIEDTLKELGASKEVMGKYRRQ